MRIIIHPNEFGTITVVYPSGELPVEVVALKDVPHNVPYKFIEHTMLPEDRTFRNAWTADFSSPDGYGLGHEVWINQQKQLGLM